MKKRTLSALLVVCAACIGVALAVDLNGPLGPGGGGVNQDARTNPPITNCVPSCIYNEICSEGALRNVRLTLSPTNVCPGQSITALLEYDDTLPSVREHWSCPERPDSCKTVGVYRCKIEVPCEGRTFYSCPATWTSTVTCATCLVIGKVYYEGATTCGPVSGPSAVVTAKYDVVSATISLECTTPETKAYPGAFVGVNDNDSNSNGTPDLVETHVVGETDLFELTLQACDPRNPPTCPVTLTLSAPQYIRLYTTPIKDGLELTGGGTVSELHFDLTAPGYTTNLWIEGFEACHRVREEVLELTYLGCPDVARLTVVSNNIDIARYQGSTVPQDMEASNGSVVKLVPKTNSEAVYLSIPKLEVFPSGAAQEGILWLKKPDPPCSSQGKVRIYKNGVIFMDEDEGAKRVTDTSGPWTLDSTHGGVVDIALIAYCASNSTREIYRDTIRVSSIPCHPNPGDTRIIFVNPDATAHISPHNDYKTNAASTIAAALAIPGNGNVLVARDRGYIEHGLNVPDSVVVGGLGGFWTVADPRTNHPQAEVFSYDELPSVGGTVGSSSTFVLGNNDKVTGFDLRYGWDAAHGGAVLAQGKSSEHVCFCWIRNNRSPAGSGGAIALVECSGDSRIEVCKLQDNMAFDYGGAICITATISTAISDCILNINKVVHDDGGSVVYDKGMGGAIATLQSTLTITNCLFQQNVAQVTKSGGLPTEGSAGGGGDIYMNTGTLKVLDTVSKNAQAGFPQPRANPEDDKKYFTGDGGSILVHGEKFNATVEIRPASQ